MRAASEYSARMVEVWNTTAARMWDLLASGQRKQVHTGKGDKRLSGPERDEDAPEST